MKSTSRCVCFIFLHICIPQFCREKGREGGGRGGGGGGGEVEEGERKTDRERGKKGKDGEREIAT
jgi:hypothetical protein